MRDSPHFQTGWPRWPHVGNAIIALWLISSAPTLGHGSFRMAGLALIALSLSREKIADRYGAWDRWVR